MTDIHAVELFLREFHIKLEVYDIRFYDFRNKNFQALLDLELSSDDRIIIIKALKSKDFVEGPLANTLRSEIGPMWVFGKTIKSKEVYIKIAMGSTDNPVVCISFHEAEHSFEYPFK